MSVLSTVILGWIALNGAVAGALLTRRSRPALREKLFQWVMRGENDKRPRSPQAHVPPSRA
jgi:hypothetical protein